MARPPRMEKLTLSRRKKFSCRNRQFPGKVLTVEKATSKSPLPRPCPGQKAPDSTTAGGHTVISTIFLVSVHCWTAVVLRVTQRVAPGISFLGPDL